MIGVALSEQVKIGPLALPGELVMPAGATALVLFAHGSDNGRHSARNGRVAAVLRQHAIATLRFDLLTADDPTDPGAGFDALLLGRRVEQALEWIDTRGDLSGLRVGLFGASTGGAAVLLAAAARPARVLALVLRSGRPEAAGDCLDRVDAATLLIVGAADRDVLERNRAALRRLHGPRRLEVIPGAGHLFEEPGALESVAVLAAAWFESHLARGQVH